MHAAEKNVCAHVTVDTVARGDEYGCIMGKGPPLSSHYVLAFIRVPRPRGGPGRRFGVRVREHLNGLRYFPLPGFLR